MLAIIRYQVTHSHRQIKHKYRMSAGLTSSHLTNFSPSCSDLDTSKYPSWTTFAMVDVFRGLCCWLVPLTMLPPAPTIIAVEVAVVIMSACCLTICTWFSAKLAVSVAVDMLHFAHNTLFTRFVRVDVCGSYRFS